MATVHKDDIVHDIAYALMRFGKNDFSGTKMYLTNALSKLDSWLQSRPEKARAESNKLPPNCNEGEKT